MQWFRGVKGFTQDYIVVSRGAWIKKKVYVFKSRDKWMVPQSTKDRGGIFFKKDLYGKMK